MKLINIVLVLTLGTFTLANTALAQSPRDELKQMVEQLQKSPTDTSLRKKIIELARELKPGPGLPEEAERRMARGTAAFKGAKSVTDYQDSAREFEQATLVAPWYGDAYFNLGVAQDKSENYEAALGSLKLAQLASPNSKEVKAFAYEVEYRNEKAHSPAVKAELEKKKNEALLAQLEGAQWHEERHRFVQTCTDEYFEIHHGEIFYGDIVVNPDGRGCFKFEVPGQGFVKAWLGKGWASKQVRLEGLNFTFPNKPGRSETGKISEDGETITYTVYDQDPQYGGTWTSTYSRVRNPRWSIKP